MPATLDALARCQVKYIELDGWDEDITKVSKFENLPGNA